jgi:hypothetical protein
MPILVFTALNSKWEFGPSTTLTLSGIVIDTWSKYMTVLVMCISMKITEVVLNDIGSPSLGFSVYDPTTRVVYGYSRNRLEVLTNTMWAANSLSYIFKTMVIVSRLDVALISAVASEIASIVVVHYLLNQKKNFIPEFDTKEDHDDSMNIAKINTCYDPLDVV